ncbi:hypothetical protein ACJ41O_011052 [Fusarium nematophilum]
MTTIRPATVSDCAAISHVHYEALNPYHVFYAAFFRKHPRDLTPIATLNALNDPSVYFLVAEDAGEVVGFIRYKVNGGFEDDTAQAPPPSVWQVKEHMKQLWETFNERLPEMDALKEKTVNGQKHYEVFHLMVHPSHQRKGIGRHLLASVIDKADADLAPTMIVSSSEGHGLYRKMGFRTLGTWEIDNELWAGKIAEHEARLGINGSHRLQEECRGMKEVEDLMIRLPKIRSE